MKYLSLILAALLLGSCCNSPVAPKPHCVKGLYIPCPAGS